MTSKKHTYKDAGVNIEAGDELVERIKSFASSTKREGVLGELGGFGGLFNLGECNFKKPILVSSTDGVGTKLKIAQEFGKHDTIGIDLVGMCVNDIIVQGAEPLFFLDYFATGKLDVGVAEQVIKGIAEGCKQARCALIGGETAEMPGMYGNGEYDLAGFSVGAVEADKVLPKMPSIHEGDVLIALPSSGVHSNGYSLVRKIVKDSGLSYGDKSPFSNNKLGEDLLEPTIIYYKHTRSLLKANNLKAMAHITGGGITENLPRVLPENCSAEIDLASWKFPPVFEWLQKAGNIDKEEMLRTFNCGVGMIMVCSGNQYDVAKEILKMDGIQHFKIGRLIERQEQQVVYINT
mgnify:CR=1 FL=1